MPCIGEFNGRVGAMDPRDSDARGMSSSITPTPAVRQLGVALSGCCDLLICDDLRMSSVYKGFPVSIGDHLPLRVLYHRFPLSYREIELMMAERRVDVT